MMKKLLVGFAALLALITAPAAGAADVNAFSFRSFEADYYLAKDADGRSTMRVREVLVAQFPDYDQNRGIERAVPRTYDGHPVSLAITSVTKADGSSWNYSTHSVNDNLVLRIGDADRYVRGEQTYIINYTLRDVTKRFETGDELYWDTNGIHWQQPFAQVTARLHLNAATAALHDNRTACFTGVAGSTEARCTITTAESADGITVSVSASRPLEAGENLTFVAGFAPDSFSPYAAAPLNWWQIGGLIALLAVGVVWYIALPVRLFVWAWRAWQRSGRDQAKQGTVIPQYQAPDGVSMLQADILVDTRMEQRALSATIVDLAVRGYLTIYETKKNVYSLELARDPSDLPGDDSRVVRLLFPNELTVGTKVDLEHTANLYEKVVQLGKDAYHDTIKAGLMVDTRAEQKKLYLWGGILLVLGLVTLNLAAVIASVAALIFGRNMPARTAQGATLKNYLDGTKMYMQVAEADRLRVLQATDTAQKINTSDQRQMVKLYERLLPLAIIYGIEKSWAKQFAPLYSPETQPSWYVGKNNTFDAAVFAGSVAGFTYTTANSVFAAPSHSSGSGFSGGGFSGGGGGGGGGGGW